MNEATIFQEAITRSTEERARFLDQVCAGKPELRAAVESLLAVHDKPDNMLDKPLAELAPTLDTDSAEDGSDATSDFTPQPGDSSSAAPQSTATADVHRDVAEGMVIDGRYTLQEKIGEGGMGEVWVAKQSHPVKRKVALKLIKAGMDSRAVLQRFEQERQALALMDHPNISRVFDGGMTPTGQPFFVMELVKGLPLTKFCDEMKLTPKERLELFVPICQAVQHAHQKGIVHRDLKPANILVTVIDGKPVPKVIDFGVAKATSGKLTQETMETGFGAVVGTLEYMSPEQAGFSGDDIDTRADIYSLGVVLYELLTGLRPIDAVRLKKAALTEMIRIVREEEPSKPSTRLSTDDALPSLAALRKTEPKKLTALLRGELDWVVMKCLEKQRDRRYETAAALVRDVQRFLADEVVEARPASAGYRLQKFTRRHKGQVIAVSLVLSALVTGMVGTTLGLFEAQKQEQEAKRQTQLARDETAEKERARDAEAERVKERDAALRLEAERTDELRHRLGVNHVVMANVALTNGDLALAEERLDEVPLNQRGWEWRYLKHKTNGGIFTMYGHQLQVTDIAFSSDGKWVLTGSERGNDETLEAKVWNARTGELMFSLDKSPSPSNAYQASAGISFHPDGKRVAMCSGGPVIVWNMQTGEMQLEIKEIRGVNVAFSLDGTRLVAIEKDGPAKVWDVGTGQPITELAGYKKGTTGRGSAVAFSADGARIAVASGIWDAKTGQRLVEIPNHLRLVREIDFSPEGSSLVISGENKALVLDASDGAIRHELEHRDKAGSEATFGSGGVMNTTFSPDGTRIVTCGGYGRYAQTTVWDARTGTPLYDLVGHRSVVRNVAFSPDGALIATGDRDGVVKVWDAEQGTPWSVLDVHNNSVTGVAISPDGKKIVTASGTQRVSTTRTGEDPVTVWVWDAQTGEGSFALNGKQGLVQCVAFSKDGTRIVTGGWSGDFKGHATVWDAATGHILHELSGFEEGVNSVAFSPDGSRIITGGAAGVQMKYNQLGREKFRHGGTEVKVWDAHTGEIVLDLSELAHPGLIGLPPFAYRGASVAFCPDGTRFVVAGMRDKARDFDSAKVCDATTGDVLIEIYGHVGHVQDVTFSPDGTKIITCDTRVVRIWDVLTGQPIAPFQLEGHTGDVNSVAFSLDGTRIVTSCGDQTVRIWDARTGATLVELQGDTGYTMSAVFDPSGTRVVAGGAGGSRGAGKAVVWSVPPANRSLWQVQSVAGQIKSAIFSEDGNRMAIASSDRQVRAWDLANDPISMLFEEPNLHTRDISDVRFSKDGSRILTAESAYGSGLVLGGKAEIKAWDVLTGKQIAGEHNFAGTTERRFSSDGRFYIHQTAKENEGEIVDTQLVSSRPDSAEIAYRLFHTAPRVERYRKAYHAARSVNDELSNFTAEFYLPLLPEQERAAAIAEADLRELKTLASEHLKGRKWELALPLLEQIHVRTSDHRAYDALETLDALTQLASTHMKLKQFEEAVPLLERRLELYEAKFGREHERTRAAISDLGLASREVGRLEDAIRLLEEVELANRNGVGSGSEQSELIETYDRAGKHAKIVEYLKLRLAEDTLTKRFSEDYWQIRMGEALLALGKWTEAEAIFRLERIASEETWGEDGHYDMWTYHSAQFMLGESLLGQKKYADAETLMIAGYQGISKKPTRGHISDEGKRRIVRAVEKLIELYMATDRVGEAEKWRADLTRRQAAHDARSDR